MKRLYLFAFLFLVSFSPQVFSNNLKINNIQISSVDTINQLANVKFDVSWDNSWRDASNWDAVWLFIKFRTVGSTSAWQHATIDLAGHVAPSGSSITIPSDGKGAFIFRDANGSGSSSFSNTTLVWKYGTDGILSSNNIDIKVFGVEMAYVPQGSFYVGDGQTNTTQIYANFESGSSGAAYQITSEAAITLGGGGNGSLGNNNRLQQFVRDGGVGTFNCTNDGCLVGSGDDFSDVTSQSLAAAFPKGYNAFYCMKYELTQQQYVDMLNCLTTQQQTTYLTQTTNFYYTGTLASNRYNITASNNVYSTSTPHIPMIFCDWIKAAAYADWSALRPMTELEFEKAARGLNSPVVDEFAWGNANVDISNNLVLANADQPTETVSSGYDGGGTNGNCWIRVGSQTMQNIARVGIFADNAGNTGRVTSGASIWGIMELSGNAWERAVSVGHSEGRRFTGLHGDGNLNSTGYADVSNWPGTFGGSTVNNNVGVGYRGGGLAYPTPNLERNARISNRRVASGYWTTVINDDGARFVRTSN